MSCIDLTAWQGTRIVAQTMAVKSCDWFIAKMVVSHHFVDSAELLKPLAYFTKYFYIIIQIPLKLLHKVRKSDYEDNCILMTCATICSNMIELIWSKFAEFESYIYMLY